MIARAAALGSLVLVAGLALYLLLFSDGGGHPYKLVFENAGQLVKGDNVQIGGERVGTVKGIKLRNDNRAEVDVKVQEPYAPLHAGTQAVIRLTSLSGIANRYVGLTPGPDSAAKLDDGDVLVHGESVPNMADDDLFEMRKKFGVLFQDGALFGSMNLWDNVAFPLRQHTDKGEDEIGEIVNRRLREVGLEGAAEKMPNELSGGMRKRAGFARALVLDPDIVLFDEPDSGLDPVRTALLCELIQEIHEENGGAYVVITHDIMSAKRVAEYIAVLWKGRIVESGPAEELFNSDNQFVRQFLSGASRGPLGME